VPNVVDIVAAAISSDSTAGSRLANELNLSVLAADIEQQSESWGHLLLRLRAKNTAVQTDILSESVLALQLTQSRLVKTSAALSSSCAAAKVAVAAACSRMVKVLFVLVYWRCWGFHVCFQSVCSNTLASRAFK
jgi:predicted Rossmann fold nucleotide-binding protein DprA/Smf involved in DNA uptake